MRSVIIAVLLLSHTLLSAQADQYNILNRDSFAPNVKKATLNCYLFTNESANREPESSKYYECDSMGRWVVRTETFSDGDTSHDTVKYDPKTHKRIVSRSNDFEPSESITIFNNDGTVKSFQSQPAQRDPQLTEFEYDQKKRVIKKTTTFVENKTVETYQYDDIDRLVNLRRSSGSVTAKKLQLDYEEKYEYSGLDASMMFAFYYGANEQIRVRDTVTCTYDDARRLTSKVEMRENGGWKRITTYTYDERGRVVGEQWETVMKSGPQGRAGHKNMEYDSLGYYSLYVVEETSYGFSNSWTTQYNEYGLPVQSYYQTATETFYYEWVYEYR